MIRAAKSSGRVIDVVFKSMMEIALSEEMPNLKDFYIKQLQGQG